MIGISKLYCGTVEPSDPLRYGRRAKDLPSHLLQFSEDKKPVVVWNITRACNLMCLHCYAQATAGPAPGELTLKEGEALIDDLAAFGSPVILFSGGEPMMHPQLLHYMLRAKEAGLRVVLSTNGLLLDEVWADKFRDVGLSYIGISLDGLKGTHDAFRRLPGAFDKTVANIRMARSAGLKVGLRLTLSRRNAAELNAIFDFIETENIPRACFYHLVPSGRGEGLGDDRLSHAETRAALDTILERTARLHRENRPTEILTVDNHADGPYLYMKLKAQNDPKAENVLKLLTMNGGNSSGAGIGAVSWDGVVHPDQFWRQIVLGSVRDKPFSQIWTDRANELLMQLKNKKEHVTGRCRACRFLDVCGGNLRARAHALTGEIWGEDPACYLTAAEIG